VSWEALARRVRELAVGLAAAGVRPGHRVALLVPPSAELTAAVYAVWRAGGVVVLADKGLGLSGMGRALRSANVDHVIGSGAGLAAAVLMRLPGTRFAAGPVSDLVLRAVGATARLADLARRGQSSSGPAPQLPPEPGQEDDCTVIFTSGAAGPAKGVVYRHRQVEAQLELLRSTYRLTERDRFVAAFAPFALLGPALGISTGSPGHRRHEARVADRHGPRRRRCRRRSDRGLRLAGGAAHSGLAASPDEAAREIESPLTPTDAALQVGDGEFHEFFLSCTQNGLAPGSQGWWDDNCMLEPWGFDLADIAVPILLQYGGQDVFVPTGHGEWPAQHIPGVEARLLDDDGHARW